jgi:hypothetical protein
MDTSTLIIYCIFICINSAVLFFIYALISRWIKTTEKKIGDLEHIVRSTDEYIKYNKHIADVVYLNYLDGLQRIFIARERFEDAEKLKKIIAIYEYKIFCEMKENANRQTSNMWEEDLDRMWYQHKNKQKD